jgi:hypothetical protein
MNNIKTRWGSYAVMAAVAISASITIAFAEETERKEDKIARAMRAAPPSVSQNAAIVDVDGTVLRSGTNEWVCMPGLWEGDDHPMCNDAVWMKFMQAIGAKAEFRTDRIGLSYMLDGDAKVNNADPFDTEPAPGEVWVEEGPHLMILLPDSSLLEGVSDDPHKGGPYVMWKDTPYAHIMIPVASREK